MKDYSRKVHTLKQRASSQKHSLERINDYMQIFKKTEVLTKIRYDTLHLIKRKIHSEIYHEMD